MIESTVCDNMNDNSDMIKITILFLDYFFKDCINCYYNKKAVYKPYCSYKLVVSNTIYYIINVAIYIINRLT